MSELNKPVAWREFFADYRYQSRQGLGQRGIMEHHMDALGEFLDANRDELLAAWNQRPEGGEAVAWILESRTPSDRPDNEPGEWERADVAFDKEWRDRWLADPRGDELRAVPLYLATPEPSEKLSYWLNSLEEDLNKVRPEQWHETNDEPWASIDGAVDEIRCLVGLYPGTPSPEPGKCYHFGKRGEVCPECAPEPTQGEREKALKRFEDAVWAAANNAHPDAVAELVEARAELLATPEVGERDYQAWVRKTLGLPAPPPTGEMERDHVAMEPVDNALIALAHWQRNHWPDTTPEYWLQRLTQEVGELAGVLAKDHDDTMESEALQISSIALNMVHRFGRRDLIRGEVGRRLNIGPNDADAILASGEGEG